jgi:hypothetical protein
MEQTRGRTWSILPRQGYGGQELRQEKSWVSVTQMIVHLVDGTYELFSHFYRVKGFASRGLVGLF